MDPNELLKQLGIDLVKDAENLAPVEGEYEFKIYTRNREGQGMALKAWTEKDEESGEEEMLISGIASSTIKDLHGDTMLPSALIDMERSAKDNLTIFLNHDYDVPEDVAGSVLKASLTSSVIDEKTGAPIYDLNFERVRINRENDRAVKSWRAMKAGTKLGMSIGARIPEGGAVRNKKTGALLISHVELLETSIVGIPANPRSWIDYAAKSLKAGTTPVRVWQGVDLSNSSDFGSISTSIVDTTTSQETVLELEGDPIVVGEAGPETIVVRDTEPAEGDASTNTDAPSQELLESEPENDGAVATPDVVAAATDVLARGSDPEVSEEAKGLLAEAHSVLASVTDRLIDTHRALEVEKQRADSAEAERDQMRRDTENVIVAVADLIDRVGKLPAGQKASFKAIQRDFRATTETFEGLGLAPEVVRMLTRSPE